MEAKTIGRAVAVASLAFGVTDLIAGKVFGRGIGAGAVEGGTLFRTVAARELVTGAIGLAFPASSVPVWTRFAADLTDMAALGPVIARPNPKRTMAVTALAIVAVVAVMDLLAARAIERRSRPSD